MMYIKSVNPSIDKINLLVNYSCTFKWSISVHILDKFSLKTHSANNWRLTKESSQELEPAYLIQ